MTTDLLRGLGERAAGFRLKGDSKRFMGIPAWQTNRNMLSQTNLYQRTTDPLMGAELFGIVAAMGWAVDAILVRIGSRYSTPASAALVSFIIASCIFWTILLSSFSLDLLSSPANFYFSLSGFLQPAMVRLLYYTGIVRLGVSRAGPVRATTPLFAIVLAYFFLKERPGFSVYAGVILTVAGVWLISYRREGEAHWRTFDLIFPLGAALLAAISQNIRKTGLLILPNPLVAVTVNTTTSLILFVATLLATGKIRTIRINRESFPYYGGAAIAASAAQLLTFTALSGGQVSVVVALLNTTPLFILLFTFVFLRKVESLTRAVVIGVCVLVGGIVLITLR
ncbi:MAG: DMT family transporter [Deltaproteobacteria bacterium]|nr:DMT family transporter [Deltaproteobacteria bacterium]